MKALYEGGHFFEGARWRDGFWWVSDLYGPHVLKISTDGKSEIVARVENQPSGLGWLPNGDLLIVSMKDRKVLRRDRSGVLRTHADIVALTGSFANDMVTDAAGHSYVSNLGFDIFQGEPPRPADLVMIDADGAARIVAKDMLFPNGMVVTADNRTLIVAETFGGRLTAFSIGPDGSLSDRRVWAVVGKMPPWDDIHTLGQTDVMPDGCAIDSEGCVWMADAMSRRVLRVAEGKGAVAEVRAPDGFGVYSCALGGDNGDQLLMCVAPDFDDVKRKAKKEAALYVAKV